MLTPIASARPRAMIDIAFASGEAKASVCACPSMFRSLARTALDRCLKPSSVYHSLVSKLIATIS